MKGGWKSYTGSIEGSGLRVAILVSRFNEDITTRLLNGALNGLRSASVKDEDVDVFHCPGAFELPLLCRRVLSMERYDAAIALGAVIRGETAHFEYVARVAADGIARVSLELEVPIAFGVLTTETFQQALDRAGDGSENKGWEAAMTALEMANLFRRVVHDV